MDLHVTESDGEKVYYKNPQSKNGGRLSDDITEGYGPEIYKIRNAAAGKYRIGVQYFSGDSTASDRNTIAHVTLYHRDHGALRTSEFHVPLNLDQEIQHITVLDFTN